MSMATLDATGSRARASRLDWTPYLAGIGIGVLSWIAFGYAKDPIGVTTAYGRLAGEAAIPLLGAEAVATNTYWKAAPFALDYGVLFLVGIMIGAFVSAIVSGTFKIELVPEVWKQEMGGSVWKRFVYAFLGGVVIMYGARLAGGCTSGHGISGGLQLAVSSWLFLAVMFATGLIASFLLFHAKKA
jgi:uncharacterized membrane protein YedE/YeeE